MSLRVAMVAQDFPPSVGGIQTYSFEFARRLAERCSAFVVIAPAQSGDAVTDASLPFDVVRVPGGPAFPLTHGPALLAALRARHLDTVLAMHWGSSLESVLLRRAGRIARLVTAVYGRELLLEPWARVPIAQAAYNHARRTAIERADAVVCCSRYTVTLAHALGARATHVVPGGVDPGHFAPTDARALRRAHGLESDRVILVLCRLVRRKGVDTLLRALPMVRARVPNARLVIVGEGTDRRRLEALARSTGVADRVLFVGRAPQADLVRWYSAADVFAMPARLEPPDVEGFGIVFLEASACAVPVVGPNEGGPLDAIIDGETGICCDPRDSDAVAQALLTLLENPERARAIGLAGRRYVEREGTWEHASGLLVRALDDQAC